ncbi:MAG: hypothetical protein QG657_722 [Acidobacteriota bacterium]|nr:hypothetical protein [Acidobacteriota bacterium]
MLKVFTIKFENSLESFNDSGLADFLADKELIRWTGRYFEHKNEHYWTVIAEYSPASSGVAALTTYKSGAKRDERYKELLTENDWPLFNRLREWRAEKGRKDGVPPYIIFTNFQLARIAVTQPVSLNAFQQIEGVGDAKREKYGNDIIQIVKSFGLPLQNDAIKGQHG